MNNFTNEELKDPTNARNVAEDWKSGSSAKTETVYLKDPKKKEAGLALTANLTYATAIRIAA